MTIASVMNVQNCDAWLRKHLPDKAIITVIKKVRVHGFLRIMPSFAWLILMNFE